MVRTGKNHTRAAHRTTDVEDMKLFNVMYDWNCSKNSLILSAEGQVWIIFGTECM